MDPRFLTAKLSAFVLKTSLRLVGRGGTAAPGLVAGYIDPKSLIKLSNYVSDTVLVTGTNGKTTTARIIGSVLEKSDKKFIHNREGSNLMRGIIGSLISKTPIFPSMEKPIALLEVDEVTLPKVISQTNPRIIVINNLFRDQLDRYGEVETIRKIWVNTLRNLDDSTIVILNSDDPSVAHLGEGLRGRVIYFGIEDKKYILDGLPHASDFTSCIECGTELKYDVVYMSHLGRYKCQKCGLKRPKPDVYAEKIDLKGETGFRAKISTPEGKFDIKTSIPGLYNVYNSLGAISAALALNISLPKVIQAFKGFEAAFGRTEVIDVAGKKLFLALAKNPTGFNELIRTIFAGRKKKYAFIAVNDLIADGRDVSWLWDVDFELMKGKLEKVWVSGTRGADMSLRLKYADIKVEDYNSNITKALEDAYTNIPQGETLFVFHTYTPMLAIKKFLSEKGYGERFWED